MTPLERAAIAAQEAAYNSGIIVEIDSVGDFSGGREDAWRAVARAVALAFCEPSEAMLSAAEEAEPADSWPGAWDHIQKLAAAQFSAMIAAALAE